VEQRGKLLAIRKHVHETIEARQMGMTFMVTVLMARHQVLYNRGGTETDLSRALLHSMDITYQQMINSQIAYHYHLACDVDIGEIPLIEDRAPTYFRAPLVTRIEHFQKQ
jgi:hypothetical protein